MLPHWITSIRRTRQTTPPRRARLRQKFRIELLETRELLSTVFHVTTEDDTPAGTADEVGTLRYAIDQANALAPNTPVTIDFSIGTGQQTISLLQPLPTLANPITIDGTTQPGYAGKPLIQVDGTQAGAGTIGFSLDDDSHNSTIKALEITDFNGGGILDDNGNANVFTNDVIGLHVVTNLPSVQPNGTFGIEIRDQANGNMISNVVVAGNQYNGIVINNSMNNTVTASDIGTDATGEDSLDRNAVALGNGVSGGGGSGIVINGSANHNTISNNIIVNNESYGIYIIDLNTSHNLIVGNDIGIDKAGTTALGNVLDGVALVNAANANSIGQAGNGNVISGNGRYGVWINGMDTVGDLTSFNTLAGNLIGTNAAGTGSVPNALDGVVVNGGAIANNIGSTATGTGNVTQTGGNVISGNSEWGVYISDSGTNRNTVQNDYIGTNVNGNGAVPNGFNGLDVVNSAASNTIGGTTAAARNVISGNLFEGVLVGLSATENLVEGNFIGTNLNGNVALPNGQDGVYVGLGAVNNTIGSPSAKSSQNFAAYNVISGNATNGIKVTDSGTSGTTIAGNFIGTDSTGKFAVPNQNDGVFVASGTSGTSIGSGSSSYANLNVISGNTNNGLELDATVSFVAFTYIGADVTGQKPLGNGGNGVLINGASGNSFQLDVIQDNTGYGILTINGASNNYIHYDSIYNNALGGISEQGNPSLQPAPVLNSATSINGTTTISGSIVASPSLNTQLSLDFYASPASTAPASIQGKTYLGSATVTTDANGNATFTAVLTATVPAGQIITATSLVGISSTSQFSNAVAVVTSSVSFLGTDGTTEGAWRTAYGADGYDIAADTSATNPKLPSYATLNITGATTYVWAANTTDPRALQNAAGTGNIASTWYSSTSMSFNLDVTDGNSHEVSLYAVDFDNQNRGELVQVIDAATGTVLSTQKVGSFKGGDYFSWTISGNVVIKVTNLNLNTNAVISGLFFGGKPSATSTATFLGTDGTTEGAWRNAYGADGYDIAADTSATNPKLPSYATLNITGATTYVWSANTTDPRALQNAAGTGHIASTWYTSTSMSVNLDLTDGNSHEVSLYAVDFDNRNRSEQMQVIDALTGTVLSTQTLSSFKGGDYLSWTISGNVVIKVTNLNPNSNAVISGLFFG
jgi:Right handed beta helix region